MTCEYRVAIVDDHATFRQALKILLERVLGFCVIAEAENGRNGIKVVEEHKPDVVLMDISMPIMNGFEATKIIASRFPHTRVVILSMRCDREIIRSSYQAGASDYLCKGCSPKEIRSAIKKDHQ
jgi:two-component system response regulator DegU